MPVGPGLINCFEIADGGVLYPLWSALLSVLNLKVGRLDGDGGRHQDNGDLGQRIYREAPNALGKGKRASGKKAVPPPAPLWETVSTSLEEVQEFEVSARSVGCKKKKKKKKEKKKKKQRKGVMEGREWGEGWCRSK